MSRTAPLLLALLTLAACAPTSTEPVETPCPESIFYPDGDGDGFGDDRSPIQLCQAEDGYIAEGGDCDDDIAAFHPGAEELCDGLDGDCDGVLGAEEVDEDGDGSLICAGDCDDTDAAIHPTAAELCDGIDNDCDGETAADETDNDGDGLAVCQGDCDDTDATFAPGAEELCDGLDQDCDGEVGRDELDLDEDGVRICQGDCDDADPAVVPGAEELCDGVDNDCDGSLLSEEADADSDGALACIDDCDDTRADIHPAAPEACDGVDNDCDGEIDEGTPDIYYPDVDGDGLGDASLATELCSAPAGWVDNGDDPEPDCATNDTDDCGVCAGGNADMDCEGLCFGPASVDLCGACVNDPDVEGEWADWDEDGLGDSCDQCGTEAQGGRFIVDWLDVGRYGGGGGPYRFQVVLYENGDIFFQYADMPGPIDSATVGLESGDGLSTLQLAFNEPFLDGVDAVYLQSEGAAGYSFDPADPPPMAWLDATGVGTDFDLADDDSITVPLPFDFPYWGETFSEVRIGSNGFLRLGDTGPLPGYTNGALPAERGALIAPFWDDLNPAAAGSLRFHSQPAGCEADCDGVMGGLAIVDDCGECVGSSAGGSFNQSLDCSLTCGGTAFVDDCGICAGGDTGVVPDDCELLPDILPLQDYLASTLSIEWIDVGEDSCLVAEGCVADTGVRKVLRFGTRYANIGNADVYLGSPPGPFFIWDDCHGHYHFEEYADYSMYDAATGAPVGFGHKNGFCLLDSGVYDPAIATEGCVGYNCGNQGVTAGCYDTYGAGLQCQWVDVTDVTDGVFDLEVTLNPTQTILESDYSNNTAAVRVEIVGDTVSVVE